MNYKRISFTFVLAVLGVLWIWVSRVPEGQRGQETVYAAQPGFRPPDIHLSTLDGSDFHLDDISGRPLVINFWASWCPPCRAEMPTFQQVYEEYRGRGLIIAAVNATNQDTISDAVDFATTNHLTFPILLDISGSASRSYNIHSLPTTVFVDREGVIQKIIVGGPIPAPLIRVELEKLLQDTPDVSNN